MGTSSNDPSNPDESSNKMIREIVAIVLFIVGLGLVCFSLIDELIVGAETNSEKYGIAFLSLAVFIIYGFKISDYFRK